MPTGKTPPECAQTLHAGPLAIEVYVSRTATLFHVVDQLAGWSPFCHAQYRRHYEGAGQPGFSGRDEQRLAGHAALRRAKGWGGGLEQTFYTPATLETALAEGVREGHLTPEQAAAERRVFAHFAPRVDALMAAQSGTLAAFREKLAARQNDLGAFAAQVARFCGVTRLRVPVYLIANPDERNCGGGYNGGRLTLEVPSDYDVYPLFQHELFHAFLTERDLDLRRSVQGIDGLDLETLSEGIAYALAPGILRPGGGSPDPLQEQAAADWRAGKTLDDSYARFRRFGLALRPLLQAALADDSQTLDTFLPRAADAWHVLTEISAAVPPAREL